MCFVSFCFFFVCMMYTFVKFYFCFVLFLWQRAADARDEASHGASLQRGNGRARGGGRPRGAAAGRRRGSRVERGQNLPRIASCMMALFFLRSTPPAINHQPFSHNHDDHHQARSMLYTGYLVLCDVSDVDFGCLLTAAVFLCVCVFCFLSRLSFSLTRQRPLLDGASVR